MDPALTAKLQFQLERLKLNVRYRAQVNKYLSEQRTAMLMLHVAGDAVFSEFLQRSSAALGGVLRPQRLARGAVEDARCGPDFLRRARAVSRPAAGRVGRAKAAR